MGLFTKLYQVKPNTIGYLFRENRFEQKLEPGYHEISDRKNRTELISLPTTSKLITIANQEVLTKDNIAFRFSYNLLYRISDCEQFLSQFALNQTVPFILAEAERRIYSLSQLIVRNKIAEYESEELNEKRHELFDLKTPEMAAQAATLGIEVVEAQLKDLTFPKAIQDLFSRHLEAKIRSRAELENARTAVATARALKNASELMKDDDNIRFFQVIETITKIAEKGKHTFMIGDLNQIGKK